MGLLRERYAGLRNGPLQYCCKQVWTKNGVRIPWNAAAMVRNIQNLLCDGNSPCERRFGVPFNGPVVPFGAVVDYHPISGKDLSRLHQFGKKILSGTFLGYALYAGGIWKGDFLVADIG